MAKIFVLLLALGFGVASLACVDPCSNGSIAPNLDVWKHGTGPGSEYYCKHGTEIGSAHFWRHGTGPGSENYCLNKGNVKESDFCKFQTPIGNQYPLHRFYICN